MKKSEISLAIMVLKYGLDYLQYLWDPLIAFFMAEFPSQAHFLGLTHVSGQKRAPGHGTPFCALVRGDGWGTWVNFGRIGISDKQCDMACH